LVSGTTHLAESGCALVGYGDDVLAGCTRLHAIREIVVMAQ
jgi:hypothetical protein